MDFTQSTAVQFVGWVIPHVRQGETLNNLISGHPEFNERTRSAFSEWSQQVRENYTQIEKQLGVEYVLPELEILRVEAGLSILQGLWQGAICLTNVLLEAFLKLALVYSNDSPEKNSEKSEDILNQLFGSLSDSGKKYMQMNLNNTINTACAQNLIDEETRRTLHEYRERFRNAFFHADMQKMFGDQTVPVAVIKLGNNEIEGPNEVPVCEFPFIFGEAMWQNASANAIPYFKYVDQLIRKTLPIVFKELPEDRPQSAREDSPHGK